MGLSFDLEPETGEISMNTEQKTLKQLSMDEKVIDKMKATSIRATDDMKIVDEKMGLPEAEPEEGEITSSESADIDPIDFEYEAISSDEEFTLRQKIEALEARNSELEKIASISARSQDPYGYGRSSAFNAYKQNQFPLVDERKNILHRAQFSSHHRFTKSPELKRIHEKYSHLEYLSSDEFNGNLSDVGGNAFSDSLKQYERFKKQRRQKHYDLYANGERDKCRAHGKRRCCDMYVCENDDDNLLIDKKRGEKRRRSKRSRPERINRLKDNIHTYATSSDDDCIEVTNRDVLRVALNIKEVEKDVLARSTLSHKLNAFRSKSSDRNDLDRKTRKRLRKSGSEEEIDKERGRQRALSDEGKVSDSNESTNDNDDTVSLEEQELRLIALKSAVLKKHEARKKRKALSTRPYSPTDSMLTPTGDDNIEQRICLDEVEPEDNNNMDISSASSPQSIKCQPMDMELASDDSKSPIFFYAKNVTYPPTETWNWMYSVPLQTNNCYVDEQYMKYVIPESLPIELMPVPSSLQSIQNEKDDESELRAHLIATMKTSKTSLHEMIIENAETVPNEIIIDEPKDLHKENIEDVIQDESLEADYLRSLLLQSIRQKQKSKPEMDLVLNIGTKQLDLSLHSDQSKSPTEEEPLSIPKIASNLKEAVKRIKQNELSNAAKLIKSKVEDKVTDTASVTEIIDEENLSQTKKTEKIAIKSNENQSADKLAQENLTAEVAGNKKITKPIPLKTKENVSNISTIVKSQALQQRQQQLNKLAATIFPTKKKLNPNPITNTPTTSTNNLNYVVAAKSSSLQSNIIKTATLISKGDLSKKSIIRIPDWQPVKKLIITLNGRSSSSSSDFEYSDIDESNINEKTNIICEENKDEIIREFDNASPASILMDSPSFSPYDGELSQTSNAQSPKDNQNSDESKELNEDRPKTDAFQMKLDEYLKTVRAKTEVEIVNEKNVSDPNLKTIQSTSSAPSKTPSRIITTSATTPTTTKSTTISLKPKQPNAVRHLPISSQLEYRRLINRIKMLEKQKEQKSLSMKKSQNLIQTLSADQLEAESMEQSSSSSSIPILTVTLQNQNRFIQNKESIQSTTVDKIELKTSKTTDSLKKQVLLKNTINSAKNTATAISKSNETDNTTSTLDDKTVEEKTLILVSAENRFIMFGDEFLNELESTHQLVLQTQIEATKQLQLQCELDEMKRKMEAIETKLNHQKIITQNFYPKIVAKQRSIATHRKTSLKMLSYCKLIGHKMKGDDYKFNCDTEDKIKEKIKNIQNDTKTLRIIKMKIEKEFAAGTQLKIDDQLINSTKNIGPNILPDDLVIVVPNKDDSNQRIVQQLDGVTNPNIQLDVDLNDDTSKGRYRSPLDHMQNNLNIETEQRLSDSNTIICQFDLMGKCEDKQCPYQHLTS